MKSKEDYDNYVLNIDEIDGTDVKINPDYYIHLCLVKLSNTFDGELSLKESFQKYRHIVEHIEVLCDSANLLTENYKTDLDAYKKEKVYTDEADPVVKSANLARQKLKLLMKNVFKHKVATEPMRS